MKLPNRLSNLALAGGLALGFVGFVALTAPAAASETVKKTLHGTYPIAAGGSFALENVNGAVTLESWDRKDIAVEAIKAIKSGSRERAQMYLDQLKVVVDTQPNRVKIVVRYPRSTNNLFGWLFGSSAKGWVDFKIKVPRELDLDVENVNGSIVLSGVRGDLKIATVNGAVTVARASGKIDVETVNGGLDIREAFGEISASTVNGGISASFSDVSGSANFSSINGGIDLTLPRTSRATFDFETLNGRVISDLPTDPPASKHRLDGRLNGGGARIHASTTNGSIEVTGN